MADEIKSYVEHAKILRTWFVAYGVGALAAIITKPDSFRSLSSTFAI